MELIGSFILKGEIIMKWDKIISGIMGSLGAGVNYLYGGWDVALKTLIMFMVLDYITGIICAIKDKKLSSEIGFKGLLKKVVILIVVAVGVQADILINSGGVIRSLVIFFYASMEGISILENAARMDVGIPEKLKDILLQLNDGKKGNSND